ncbi:MULTISPECIES: hypothetical protein [unclassified Microbacterium]|uniref:hypothetical protein n=1 Tax=unclassified Microbacterium TaxID=2609290 RepID=UPI00343B3B0F
MAGPSLTVDVSGNPFVEVFFDSVAPGTSTVTVYRLSEDRQWLVRGGVGIGTGIAALDFEVPFRTPATYRAEQFDALGNSLGFTDSSHVTVDYEGTVVHNPLVPASLWAPVRILADVVAPLRRPTDGELVYVEGASVAKWIGTRRQGLRDVPVSFLTETIDAADRVQAMLGTYVTQQVGVLCIRTSDNVRWPRSFFVHGDLSEIEQNVRFNGSRIRFDAQMDEVEPPFPGLVTPLLTYDDLDAFGNYTAQDAGWLTYTDRDRAYELAGLAG